ncbi:MAG: protein kinase [Chloroflexi bacterium]|nr:protein kinase [Chloroflexota bacterium]
MIETVPSGTVLHGRYRIERVLGSGGFGHVYLAVDQITNQQYAVKEYLVTGPSGQEQLKHEATVLSHLHHPNLPAFQDAFIERGRYYMVLNYYEGNDLTDLIRMARQRNEVIPLTQIMGWILAICDAVMFLHNQRPIVIHRDIKPDNIRITSSGVAILVDLGNAKAAADGARTLFFIRHQGTPGYAPPEQYPGGSGTDARSDIYALGGTLYFGLTTHEPPSVSVRNQAIQQHHPDLPSLQGQLANNPPEGGPAVNEVRQFRLGVSKPAKPAPRHSRHLAQLGTLPPELLDQLNRIIQRAMAMKPKDRYQFVIDFANDLKKVMAALPAPPPPTPSRPLDPHGTQPDLPMLYDAIQAAKENSHPGSSDANMPAVSPQPSSSPTQTNYCPRCNSPLVPQASFCPRCGTSLPNPNQTNMSNPGTVAKDISQEQTLIVKPQALAMQIPPTPSRDSSPHKARPASSPVNAPASLHGAPPVHNTTSTAMQVSASAFPQSRPTPTNTAKGPSTDMEKPLPFAALIDPRIIILILIAVIILAIILALFLLNQLHHGPTSLITAYSATTY